MTARTAEHTLKMGLGQVRNAASKATPEELAALRETALRQINEVFGVPDTPAVPDDQPLTEAVPEDAPPAPLVEAAQKPAGEYIDHSDFRRSLQARIDTLTEQINRSTNERQINQWGAEIGQLQWCIERAREADSIPVHKSRWGNDGRAKGLHIATHDMLDTPRPLIKFSLYRFETDKPFRIACLRHYASKPHMTNTRIFEIPLGHEAYCDMDGQFVGFAASDFVSDLVEKGRARRPRP